MDLKNTLFGLGFAIFGGIITHNGTSLINSKYICNLINLGITNNEMICFIGKTRHLINNSSEINTITIPQITFSLVDWEKCYINQLSMHRPIDSVLELSNEKIYLIISNDENYIHLK